MSKIIREYTLCCKITNNKIVDIQVEVINKGGIVEFWYYIEGKEKKYYWFGLNEKNVPNPEVMIQLMEANKDYIDIDETDLI